MKNIKMTNSPPVLKVQLFPQTFFTRPAYINHVGNSLRTSLNLNEKFLQCIYMQTQRHFAHTSQFYSHRHIRSFSPSNILNYPADLSRQIYSHDNFPPTNYSCISRREYVYVNIIWMHKIIDSYSWFCYKYIHDYTLKLGRIFLGFFRKLTFWVKW